MHVRGGVGMQVPMCLNDESWPDATKTELSGQLQITASLTEPAWDAQATRRPQTLTHGCPSDSE